MGKLTLIFFLMTVTFGFAADNPLIGENVVYLGGEMKKSSSEWVGKNTSDVLPKSSIQNIVILRSISSAPLVLHEAAVERLWTTSVKTIAVENPNLDAKAWFDAVVVLKSGDYVRVTLWNENGRFISLKGIGFFNRKEIYVQPDVTH